MERSSDPRLAAANPKVLGANGQQPQSDSRKLCRIFLCHNSNDKNVVKSLADALELDFGIPHFLDVYAIPTGEAFIPWIEVALAESTGCAIFLGANGWGATHLWEAELALARARRDREFRLIPVALPGMTEVDMAKLGSGTLFREINWADFTKSLDDPDAREKLRAALTGEELQGDRGPSRLTPYQIRRDTARWATSKGVDASVLYRGRQLTEAERLARENPDLLAIGEVVAFLAAGAERQKRFWRRLALASTAAALVILASAVLTFFQYLIAEERRATSDSRRLAIIARETDGADRALLVSIQAYRLSATLEAARNLFEQVSTWRNLTRLIYVGVSVEAVAVTDRTLVAGTEDGDIHFWELSTGRPIGMLKDFEHHGRVGSVYVAESTGDLWVGREDGRIDVARKMETGFAASFDKVSDSKIIKPLINRQILAITGHAGNHLIATGSASGLLAAFDAKTLTKKWEISEDQFTQITALAFDRTGGRLFAGTQLGKLLVVDSGNGAIIESIPGFDGGVRFIAIPGEGDSIAIVSSYGQVSVFAASSTGYLSQSHASLPPLVTSVGFSAKPGWLVLGDGDGSLHLRDLYGAEASFGSLAPHRSVVRAVAFNETGTLVSAAGDGVIAIWDLQRSLTPAKTLPSLPLDPSTLRVALDNELIAAGSTTGRAGIWRLRGDVWELTVDLLQETIRVAGPEMLATLPNTETPVDGFVPIGESEVVSIALDKTGNRAVWATKGGGIVAIPLLDFRTEARILDRTPEVVNALTISLDGRFVAAAHSVSLMIYDLKETSEKLPTKIIPKNGVRSLAFDNTNERLAIGLNDGTVEFIRIRDGAELFTTEPLWNGPVGGLLFTPNGESLISYGVTSANRGIAIFPISYPADVRRLQLHQAGGNITAITVGSRAGYLAVGDLDGRVRLWRLGDLSYVATLVAGGSFIGALTFDERADRFITASADMGLLEWLLDPEMLIQSACAKVARELEDVEWREILPDQPLQPVCQDANGRINPWRTEFGGEP